MPPWGEHGLHSGPAPMLLPEAALTCFVHQAALTWQAVPGWKRDWLSVSRAGVDRKQHLHVLSEIYSSVYF